MSSSLRVSSLEMVPMKPSPTFGVRHAVINASCAMTGCYSSCKTASVSNLSHPSFSSSSFLLSDAVVNLCRALSPTSASIRSRKGLIPFTITSGSRTSPRWAHHAFWSPAHAAILVQITALNSMGNLRPSQPVFWWEQWCRWSLHRWSKPGEDYHYCRTTSLC